MNFVGAELARADLERCGFALVQDFLDEAEGAALLAEALGLLDRSSAVVERGNPDRRLCYRVVTGDRIQTGGPLIFGLYADPEMLTWAQNVTRLSSLARSPHLRSAININCLRGPGQQYPWHRDAVPYTSILFLTSVPRSAGGAFLIRAIGGDLVAIQPQAGALLFMDGAQCAHAVSPLLQRALRVTVPMVYPAEHLNRPAGLDEYLYGTRNDEARHPR